MIKLMDKILAVISKKINYLWDKIVYHKKIVLFIIIVLPIIVRFLGGVRVSV